MAEGCDVLDIAARSARTSRRYELLDEVDVAMGEILNFGIHVNFDSRPSMFKLCHEPHPTLGGTGKATPKTHFLELLCLKAFIRAHW